MRIRKALSALLAAAMLCCVAGCARDETETAGESSRSSSSSSEKSSSSKSASESSNSTQGSSSFLQSASGGESEPEFEIDGIELDEQLITLPCRVGDIKNITIDRGLAFSVRQRDNGGYMSTSDFNCNDTAAGAIYLEGDCSGKADLGGEKVIGIVASDSRVAVSYLGLTFGSSAEEIIKILGEPEKREDNYMYYLIEPEGSVTFSLNPENKVTDIAIFLDIR